LSPLSFLVVVVENISPSLEKEDEDEELVVVRYIPARITSNAPKRKKPATSTSERKTNSATLFRFEDDDEVDVDGDADEDDGKVVGSPTTGKDDGEEEEDEEKEEGPPLFSPNGTDHLNIFRLFFFSLFLLSLLLSRSEI
jgi:hypothetical protein